MTNKEYQANYVIQMVCMNSVLIYKHFMTSQLNCLFNQTNLPTN
jgi:hypothetical protein